jgi:hypothetical protein
MFQPFVDILQWIWLNGRQLFVPVRILDLGYCCVGTLREECRLRVFDSRVLRRIFGPKRDR